MDMMDKRRIKRLAVVLDNSDFVEVLQKAKLRCLKTLFWGDINDEEGKERSHIGCLQMEGPRCLKMSKRTYNPEVEKKP